MSNGIGGVPCFGCSSPIGDPAPNNSFGVWISTGAAPGFHPWTYVNLPSPSTPTLVTTPAQSPSADGPVEVNPVAFSSAGTGNAPPNAGQPLTVTGNAGSTGDPNQDGKRRVTGVVNGIVFGN